MKQLSTSGPSRLLLVPTKVHFIISVSFVCC